MYPRIGILLLALLLSACAGTSRFVGHHASLTLESIPDPDAKVWLLYQHGSQPENVRDPCHPSSSFLPGRVPPVISNLAGQRVAGREVVVFALCTSVPGRFGGYGEEDLKVRWRADEIEALVNRVRGFGVPQEQIFLVGHSAGAWASLLLQARSPEPFNAVIGFAPAFAGQKVLRSSVWQTYFEAQLEEIIEAETLDALLYVFERDPYYDLSDMKPLAGVSGVTIVWPQDSSCWTGHRAVFRRCFQDAATDEIRRYLHQRLTVAR